MPSGPFTLIIYGQESNPRRTCQIFSVEVKRTEASISLFVFFDIKHYPAKTMYHFICHISSKPQSPETNEPTTRQIVDSLPKAALPKSLLLLPSSLLPPAPTRRHTRHHLL
jgi:hypothetical protein